jgi:hypothetical protein
MLVLRFIERVTNWYAMKICLSIERYKVQSSPVAEPVEAKGEWKKE